MTTTPNYGFNIAEGTDTVNLLTQSYPNFTNLDSILKAIEDTGITTSVATKVGTVFNIVRTNTDLAVMRFVATANYAAGDTFTVDGVSVTATAMNGTALPAGAFVINQSVEAILNGSVLTIVGVSGATSIAAQDVTYDNTGSGLTATDVQNAIDELLGDIPANAAALGYNNTVSGLTATDVQAAIDETVSKIPSDWEYINEATGNTPINFVKADYTEVCFVLIKSDNTYCTSNRIFTADLTQYMFINGGYSGGSSGYNFSVESSATTVKIAVVREHGADVTSSWKLKVYARK